MKLAHLMSDASGFSDQDCHFLVLRYEEKLGFKPDRGESWVVQSEGDMLHALYGMMGWFTSLWRSPAGCTYVSDSAGTVHVNPDVKPRAKPWRQHKLKGVLSGVWGLDDKCVFVWGGVKDKDLMYRWDGKDWKEMESPGEVVGMHGLAPNLIYAVGAGGLVARWDGRRWNKCVTHSTAMLSAVIVASPDEIYAVGAGGVMLEGSSSGWKELLTGPGPMFGVAKYKGDVWVGAAQHGLMKVVKKKLKAVKPNIKAEMLDARRHLLISSPSVIAETVDGKEFTGISLPAVVELLADRKPLWIKNTALDKGDD